MSASLAGTATDERTVPSGTCPTTGLKVHRQADALIKANAVVATVALLIGGIAAILVLLTRWQVVHLLDVTCCSTGWLTVHGMNMLIFFIIFFEMAVLYFAGPVLLNCRVVGAEGGDGSPSLLMVVGALMVEWTMFAGKADVLCSRRTCRCAPHPAFYLGVILFAVGALIVVRTIFFAIAGGGEAREDLHGLDTAGRRSAPLTAAIIAVITLLHGAIVYIPTWLWSIGLMGIDPSCTAWSGGGSATPRSRSTWPRWWPSGICWAHSPWAAWCSTRRSAAAAFVLYILFISMASAHHLLVDPGFGPSWKVWNTSYFMYMAVLASMIHGFTVPAGIELGPAPARLHQGPVRWLRQRPGATRASAPWSSRWSSSASSGGITGVTFGTEQINIIAHNTLRIPGHFHATVVAGTALAFMGVTYYVIPLIFRREIAFYPLARIQPYLFADRHAGVLGGDDLRRHLRRAAPPLGHHVRPGAVPGAVLALPWTW